MSLDFEVTKKSYAVEIDLDRFQDLMDAESYVTGNAAYKKGAETLFDKLNRLPIGDIEYDGHFQNFVYFSVGVEDDTDEIKAQISEVIEDYLTWCGTLPKRDEVVRRREAASDAYPAPGP